MVRAERAVFGAGPGDAVSADAIVDAIERADDDSVEAPVVKLNTPGGAVVPSEDIRRAAAEFDGPTVAYAEDLAASGGYWIASGCDEFHAREASVVGSIGVDEVTVEAFEPERGLSERVSVGAQSVARSFGAGVASVLTAEDDPVRVRL